MCDIFSDLGKREQHISTLLTLLVNGHSPRGGSRQALYIDFRNSN